MVVLGMRTRNEQAVLPCIKRKAWELPQQERYKCGKSNITCQCGKQRKHPKKSLLQQRRRPLRQSLGAAEARHQTGRELSSSATMERKDPCKGDKETAEKMDEMQGSVSTAEGG